MDKQKRKPFSPKVIQFSLNLEEQALHQVEFLKAVDNVKELKQPHVIARAIYR